MNFDNVCIATRRAAELVAVLLAPTAGTGSALGNQHSKNDNLYNVTPFGFSEERRIFAFIVTGMEEKGSEGRFFARVYFLDVHKNSFLKPKRIVVREENSGGDPSDA